MWMMTAIVDWPSKAECVQVVRDISPREGFLLPVVTLSPPDLSLIHARTSVMTVFSRKMVTVAFTHSLLPLGSNTGCFLHPGAVLGLCLDVDNLGNRRMLENRTETQGLPRTGRVSLRNTSSGVSLGLWPFHHLLMV